MRSKKVTRHYCDHCSKGGFHRQRILEHEVSCCRNPQRKCWVCEEFNFTQVPVEDLKKADGIGLLREMTDCPLCILAGILQGKIYEDDDHFDYKEEMRDLRSRQWRTVNPPGDAMGCLHQHLNEWSEMWPDGLQP